MPALLRHTLSLAALSLAGAGAVLLATRRGAGLSPDAVGYIGVARSLAVGQGVTGYDGAPFVAQPPLYPALLALGHWLFGADPLVAAPLLNALLCGAAIYLSGTLIGRYADCFPALAHFGAGFAFGSWPLFSVAVMAWSEPLFICLMLLFLLSLDRYIARGEPGVLLRLACWAALACLARYIGLVAIPAGAAAILFLRGENRWPRLRAALVFAALAALPLALWLARNQVVSGTWIGPRFPGQHTLFENLALTAVGLSGFFIPESLGGPRALRLGLGGLVAVGIGGAVYYGCRTSGEARRALARLGPVMFFALGYALFLVVSSCFTAYDDIGLRLLAPLHVPAVALVLFLAQRLVERGVRGWTLAALALMLLLPLAAIAQATARYATEGAGAGTGADRYNTWRHSETIGYLQAQEIQGALYSNAPDALYILADLRAVLIPRRGGAWASRWPEEERASLVWMDRVQRRYLMSVEELRAIARLERVARLGDGAVYEVFPKEE